jgi:uncharacterized membrane protein
MVLESIILLVLFGIVSSAIQSVIKNNKRQQQMNADVQGVKPKVEPIYEAVSKSHISMEPTMVREEIRAEAFENLAVFDIEEVQGSASSSVLTGNITFNELQRSIIMAEVLGKPKALRKAIR